MSETRPADELAKIRDLLHRLGSGEMKMVLSGVDVTQTEISILKREIAHLEKVLERLKKREA